MSEGKFGRYLVGVLKWVGSIFVALLGPFIVLMAGAATTIYGIFTGSEWITRTGVFIGAFGAAWFSYLYLSGD